MIPGRVSDESNLKVLYPIDNFVWIHMQRLKFPHAPEWAGNVFSRSGSETRASEASNPALVDFFDCVSEEWQERQKGLDFQIFGDNLSSRGLGERRFRSNTFRRKPNKIWWWNRQMFTFLPKSIFSDCSCSGYCNHLESRDAAKPISKSFSTLWNYPLVEVSASSDVGQWQDTHQKSRHQARKLIESPLCGSLWGG